MEIMAWDDTQTSTDSITPTEWNNMVGAITYGSGTASWASGNATSNTDGTWASGALLVVSGAYVETSGALVTVSGAGYTATQDILTVSGADYAGSVSFNVTSGALIDVSGAGYLDTVHRTSDGSDHSFINQNVTSTGGPTFDKIIVTNAGSIGGDLRVAGIGSFVDKVRIWGDTTIVNDLDIGDDLIVTNAGSFGTNVRVANNLIVKGDISLGADAVRDNAVPVMHLEGTLPMYSLWETDADADERQWEMFANGGTLVARTVNDAIDDVEKWLEINRNGVTVGSVNFLNGLVTVKDDFKVEGTGSIGGNARIVGNLENIGSVVVTGRLQVAGSTVINNYLNINTAADDNSMIIRSVGAGKRNSPYFAVGGYGDTGAKDMNFRTVIAADNDYHFEISDTNGNSRFKVYNDGEITAMSHLTVSGNILTTGTVDGRDIAADWTSFDNLSGAYVVTSGAGYSTTLDANWASGTAAWTSGAIGDISGGGLDGIWASGNTAWTSGAYSTTSGALFEVSGATFDGIWASGNTAWTSGAYSTTSGALVTDISDLVIVSGAGYAGSVSFNVTSGAGYTATDNISTQTSRLDTVSGAGWAVSGAYVVTSGALVTDIANLVTVSGAGYAGSVSFNVTSGALLEVSGLAYGKIANVVDDTTPQLGGNLDINEKYITVNNAMTDNLTGNGIIISWPLATNVSGGGLLVLSGNGLILADADAEATSKGLLGMATTYDTSGTAKTMPILTEGVFRRDGWNWTAGEELYIGTSAGSITSTKPSAADDIVRVAGYALTDDEIYFKPGATYVEVSGT